MPSAAVYNIIKSLRLEKALAPNLFIIFWFPLKVLALNRSISTRDAPVKVLASNGSISTRGAPFPLNLLWDESLVKTIIVASFK